MEEMVKLGAVAITAALCAALVKKNAQELGLVVALAAGAVLLSFTLGALEDILAFLTTLTETAGLSPAILAPVIKITGIAVVSRLSAELCRDAKETGIAASVETAGAILALVVALPLMQAAVSTVLELL